jgi:beta-galactosidase
VDNGDHSSDELFSGYERKMYKGFAMAILQAKQTAGRVNVKVSVKDLKAVEKILTTK